MSTAIRIEGNLYRSERAGFPFVLGLIHSKIYLPVNLDEDAMAHVIAHEQAHICRRDHWWKPLGFLLLTVYWFQPLLWVAYVLLCRDIELACDEKVIRDMNREQRADYSQALLQCSVRRSAMAACPLAFGEVGVMERVKNVLNYRKPAFWVIVAAVAACLIAAVCFRTDPVTATVKHPWVQEYTGTVDTAQFESISPAFAIGAAENGQAVFKNPEKAFAVFTDLYADTLEQLRQAFDLPQLTAQESEPYKTYGWQFTGGTETERERAAFVSRFLDIYENSFIDSAPSETPDTKQALTLEDVIALLEKGDTLTWADFEDFTYTDVGSGPVVVQGVIFLKFLEDGACGDSGFYIPNDVGLCYSDMERPVLYQVQSTFPAGIQSLHLHQRICHGPQCDILRRWNVYFLLFQPQQYSGARYLFSGRGPADPAGQCWWCILIYS